jgi:hypothetical protein
MVERMDRSFSGDYTVVEVAPSNLPSVSGLNASAQRQFKVPCQWAQDFGLRALGKLYKPADPPGFILPQLPSQYPLTSFAPLDESYPQTLRLRAVGYRIRPASDYCFNDEIFDDETSTVISGKLTRLDDTDQIAKYWKFSDTLPEGGNPVAKEDSCCECMVEVDYQEQWWHCLWSEAVGISLDPEPPQSRIDAQEWLDETAFKVDRVSSYELYTRPTRPLIWDGKSGANERLGPDSHAVTIIPSSEITIEWHNIPVSVLCEMEAHLNQFRQKVNCSEVTFFRDCTCAQSAGEGVDCSSAQTACQYEPETLLFLDYSEDKNRRTSQFGPMDTTTLVLTFKHKRIRTASDVIVGHNHLLYDKTTANEDDDWKRVKVQLGIGSSDLFIAADLNKIFSYDAISVNDCQAP